MVLQPAKPKLRQRLVDAMEVRVFVSVRRVSVRVRDVVAKTWMSLKLEFTVHKQLGCLGGFGCFKCYYW